MPLIGNAIVPINHRQQVFGVQQTNNIVDCVVIYRHAGMPGINKLLPGFPDCCIHIQCQNVHTRHHDIFGHGFAELEDGVDHLSFALVKRAFGLVLLHPVTQGFVRYG